MEERLVMTSLELILFTKEVLMAASPGPPLESSGRTVAMTSLLLLVMLHQCKMLMDGSGCHFVEITKRSSSPFPMMMA